MTLYKTDASYFTTNTSPGSETRVIALLGKASLARPGRGGGGGGLFIRTYDREFKDWVFSVDFWFFHAGR